MGIEYIMILQRGVKYRYKGTTQGKTTIYSSPGMNSFDSNRTNMAILWIEEL